MNEKIFWREMLRAGAMTINENQDYWSGYRRGLERRYHGVASDTEAEHRLWLTAEGDPSRDQSREGYRDGYCGPVDWDDLPNALRIIRAWRGWSVDEMGERVVRSGRAIENWEQGRRGVPAAAVKACGGSTRKPNRKNCASRRTATKI